MNKTVFPLGLSAFCGGVCVAPMSIQAGSPNVIVILADDMGYSDLGCYGSEIPTPNIDRLAENGLRFRNFYNTSRSCPTRASLLTGLYQHQTGVGMMTTENNNFDFGVDGYRGYLNKQCVTIAEVLKDAGYHTYMTGKWHLGSDSLYKRPLQRGFDEFFGSYQGAFSYFDPQGDRCLIDGADTIRAPKGFYTTDAFTQGHTVHRKKRRRQALFPLPGL
jgi:arylsulfatase